MKTSRYFTPNCKVNIRSFITVTLLFFGFTVHAQIDWETYPVSLTPEEESQIQFGYLNVPENRDKPDSRTIKMAFAVLKRLKPSENTDAVILIPGGPGGSYANRAKRAINSKLINSLREKRDVILLDPRGCGLSKPILCQNLNDRDYASRLTFYNESKRDSLLTKAISACKTSLEAQNVDIAGYNSIQVAHDIEALRIALGYSQWNIEGGSYGTYYGFNLMQQYPQAIRSAVFSGIVELDPGLYNKNISILEALNGSLDACAADPDCNSSYPNLEKDLQEILDRFDEQPISITLPLSSSTGTETFDVQARHVLLAMFRLMYWKEGIAIIPGLIKTLKDGNDFVLENMAMMLLEDPETTTSMTIMIGSNDRDPFLFKTGKPNVYPLKHIIKDKWFPMDEKAPQLEWSILKPIDSIKNIEYKTLNIPTLLVSGALDPITRPKYAESMLRYLPNSKHIVVPGSGHNVVRDTRFAFDKFFDNPDVNVPVEEILTIEPVPFVNDLLPNKGVSDLAVDIRQGKLFNIFVLGFFVLLNLIAFIASSGAFIRAWITKKKIVALKLWKTLWLLSLLGSLAGGLLYVAVNHSLNSNLFLPILGFSGQWWLLKLIYAAQLLVLLWMVFKFRELWLSKLKILTVVSLVGTIGFLICLGIQGFV